MSEKVAKFRFDSYVILESSIKYDEVQKEYNNLNIQFVQQKGIQEEKQKFKLDITTEIKDEKDALQIKVRTVGFFSFDKDLAEDQKRMFFNVNAPAILFPYIRAYISTLTSLSGMMPPIILPTINLAHNAEEPKNIDK